MTHRVCAPAGGDGQRHMKRSSWYCMAVAGLVAQVADSAPATTGGAAWCPGPDTPAGAVTSSLGTSQVRAKDIQLV